MIVERSTDDVGKSSNLFIRGLHRIITNRSFVRLVQLLTNLHLLNGLGWRHSDIERKRENTTKATRRVSWRIDG